MFLNQLAQTFLGMFTGVLSAAPYTIALTVFLWTLTLLGENRRLPQTREDFRQVAADLKEFGLMNLAVLVIFTVQLSMASLVISLLGV